METPLKLVAIPPVMSQEQFAIHLGVSQDTVRGWIQADTIPKVKIGKQNFVNVQLLQAELSKGKDIFSRGDYEQ